MGCRSVRAEEKGGAGKFNAPRLPSPQAQPDVERDAHEARSESIETGKIGHKVKVDAVGRIPWK